MYEIFWSDSPLGSGGGSQFVRDASDMQRAVIRRKINVIKNYWWDDFVRGGALTSTNEQKRGSVIARQLTYNQYLITRAWTDKASKAVITAYTIGNRDKLN